MTPTTPPSLCDAERQASNCGLDISKLRALLKKIKPLSEKYKIIFYLAATSSGKNLNSDFNKYLGANLKLYLELDDSDRLGITSLRRILFKKGYLVDINDDELVKVLPTRYAENSQLEQPSNLETISADETTTNQGD
ncbi:MAG: hypothetical protein GPJ08_11510 [Microcystis aeruginosa G13-09]|nr:hypothetical protein [Microcystis aeruginosa G13-09]